MKKLMTLLLSGGLILSMQSMAAGGGYGGGGLQDTAPRFSPEEIAINAYNSGLEQRDKAWRYEQEAEQLEDGKKKDKLLQKAQKAYAKAIKNYRQAIEEKQDFYQAYSSLGYALRKTGALEQSLDAYGKSLSLNPDYHEAVEYQAEAYLQLGRYEEVKVAYERLSVEHKEYAAMLGQAIDRWIGSQDQNRDNELRALGEWINARRVQ